jgi:hypothetical protein
MEPTCGPADPGDFSRTNVGGHTVLVCPPTWTTDPDCYLLSQMLV